jgi:hypothetical protein
VLRRIMHVHWPAHTLLMEAGLTELGWKNPRGVNPPRGFLFPVCSV